MKSSTQPIDVERGDEVCYNRVMAERTLLWTTTDPRGLSVSLVADVWQHIVERHDDMPPYFEAVRLTIEDPDEIYFDEQATQQKATGARVEAYYKREILGTRLTDEYLLVSVKFVQELAGLRGYVQTALPQRRIPRRVTLLWKK